VISRAPEEQLCHDANRKQQHVPSLQTLFECRAAQQHHQCLLTVVQPSSPPASASTNPQLSLLLVLIAAAQETARGTLLKRVYGGWQNRLVCPEVIHVQQLLLHTLRRLALTRATCRTQARPSTPNLNTSDWRGML
jgi:hypothetical protein